MNNNDIIKKLPKVELHCHLDGSVRTATILELAKQQGYALPADNAEELRKFVRVPLSCRSLSEFLERFEVFYPLLKNPYAMERISYELCRDCASENVKYLEMRFAPVLQQDDGFSIPQVVESVLKGKRRGEKDFPIKAGVILCLYRGTSREDIMRTAEAAVRYKDEGVCGVDVAGDESRFPLEEFSEAIQICKKEGVGITIHAGEAAGPESIRSAINMGADRIGHGIALNQDKELMKEIADKRIPLEICLTSNVHTQVVKDYPHHPVREFISNGVMVTLNTDDRDVSGIDLTYEFEKALELGITMEQLKDTIINGAETAFLSPEEKKALKDLIINEFSEIVPGK